MSSYLTMSNFINSLESSNASGQKPPTGVQTPAGISNLASTQINSVPAPVNAVQTQPRPNINQVQTNVSSYIPSSKPVVIKNSLLEADAAQLSTKLNYAKKQNGIIEKVYDGFKNLTGFGMGSKKVAKSISDVSNGQKTVEEAEKQISEYRVSEENASQAFGDVVSTLAAGGAYFGLKNQIIHLRARAKINESLVNSVQNFLKPLSKLWKKDLFTGAKNLLNSNKAAVIGCSAAAAITGGVVKLLSMKVNRFGSKRFKVDKNKELTKKDKKVQKIALKKDRKNANFRNFISGAINGAMMPVMELGALIGVPVFLLGNMVSRYFIGEKYDEKKSPSKMVSSIVKNPVINLATAALIAIPLIKKGEFHKILSENSANVAQTLSKANLTELNTGKGVYEELQDMLLESGPVKKIIKSLTLSKKDKVKLLTQENIFAVKFQQILPSESGLTKILRENCPPSRTVEEAQELVKTVFGNTYTLDKCLGTGTIAETYLAHDANGAEVCIKVLKKGINAEKIQADKEKFIQIVREHFRGKPDKKDELDYLIKSIESIAEGITKEVDFKNEAEAARKLAQYTTKANVVRPLTVKDGIYVMEKANGISLDSLTKLNGLYAKRRALTLGKKVVGDNKTLQSELRKIDEEIKAVMARTPQFKNIELDKKQTEKMFREYIDVIVEQFSRANPGGKTIHGDIHPGNIFIDVDALKTGKGKIFTLIDTGNTIEQSMEQTLRSINLSKYIHDCDIENLTDYMLDGAKLPGGMTMDAARSKIRDGLRKIFFDTKTGTGTVDNDRFSAISGYLMKSLGIIPADSQANLAKAKQSAKNSFAAFDGMFRKNVLFNFIDDNIGTNKSKPKNIFEKIGRTVKLVSQGAGAGGEYVLTKKSFERKSALQERLNLFKLPASKRIKLKKSNSTPEKNSVEYLTYLYKQWKLD